MLSFSRQPSIFWVPKCLKVPLSRLAKPKQPTFDVPNKESLHHQSPTLDYYGLLRQMGTCYWYKIGVFLPCT